MSSMVKKMREARGERKRDVTYSLVCYCFYDFCPPHSICCPLAGVSIGQWNGYLIDEKRGQSEPFSNELQTGTWLVCCCHKHSPARMTKRRGEGWFRAEMGRERECEHR